MKKLKVNIPNKEYVIHFEDGLINKVGSLVTNVFDGEKICIVTDNNVDKFYGEVVENSLKKAGYDVYKIVLPYGEKNKCFESLMQLYNKLIDYKFTRGDLLIALGGGVIGDLTGFCASTYLRGIPYIQIPTSLLAQVDSSIGGKVAVDLPKGKNLVGSFYHPKAVYIDPMVLKTLDKRFLNDGMGEVIKYAVIRDKNLFELLENIEGYDGLFNNLEKIIYTCCDIKRGIVENDERDTGERMVLNFGHTIGHAIEKLQNFEGYSHGEAVATGMYMITERSESLGLTEEGTAKKIKALNMKYELPYEVDLELDDSFISAMNVDKKNIGSSINLIVAKGIGKSFIYKISSRELKKFMIGEDDE